MEADRGSSTGTRDPVAHEEEAPTNYAAQASEGVPPTRADRPTDVARDLPLVGSEATSTVTNGGDEDVTTGHRGDLVDGSEGSATGSRTEH